MNRFFLIPLLVFFTVCGACSREYVEEAAVRQFVKKDPDAEGAIRAVKGYNNALIMTYAGNDIRFLTEYATDRELGKVGHLIKGFVSQGLRMDAEIKRMRVEKVERWGQNNVLVTTLERWKYRRVFVSTGKEEKPQTEIEYHMIYNMTRESDGNWKVFNLSPV